MSKRKSKHKVKLKNTGKGNEESKKFSTDKKTAAEVVEKSGGIITEKDITDIFNVK
jgi:hypothetical protein